MAREMFPGLGARCFGFGFVHVDVPGIPRICNGPAGVSTLYDNSDMRRLEGLVPAFASSWAYLYDFLFPDMIVAVLLLP